MPLDSITKKLEQNATKTQEYVTNTAEYYKLRLFKSSMQFTTRLVNFLVLGSVGLFVLFFFSIGIALWMGSFFEERYTGYFILAGFYAIVFVLLLIFARKPLERALIRKFSDLIVDDDGFTPKERVENREIKESQMQNPHEDETV
ncbi:phage holin family protein [Altibacter sp. HG106]|uniref:phage holin family protein n=1 Tax=Altibacter sp. HG106 TaxID=3023937 RepID=UPI002350E48C|nr:phage holin family protein [Altibacter sp. HG106]MDC7994980.1 phage holin family protein [Altibacter sp. HG106]